MKSFETLTLDTDILTSDLAALEKRLAAETHLKERAEILPFFQGRRHLCAALGLTSSSVELPNRWATELDLFGDFACDVAAGDSEANAYTLIEFEPALEYSIFMRLQAKKIDASLVAALRAWVVPARGLGMENCVGRRVVRSVPQNIWR